MKSASYDLSLSEVRDFLGPRDVRIGDGSAGHVHKILHRWGIAPGEVLLVCDAALPGLGLLEPILGSLEQAGYPVRVYDGIVGEPDTETARAAVAETRARSFSAVIGMGGGSAMDVAKVAAALARLDGDLLDYVGAELIDGSPLPLILVPTTAGTGAEATRIAMISHEGEKRIINDGKLVPLAAVLDPQLVASLPPPVTAVTGMDALSHALESVISTNATSLTIRAAMEAVELLSIGVPSAYHDGSDITARRATLYGAYLAGVGLNAGVVLGHSIAYTIANRTHLPHGATAAIALPYCLAYSHQAARERIEKAFEHVQGADADDTVYTWLDRLNNTLGLPRALRELDLDERDARDMADECVDRYPRPSNPEPLERDRVRGLYGFLWAGDLQGCVAEFTTGRM